MRIINVVLFSIFSLLITSCENNKEPDSFKSSKLFYGFSIYTGEGSLELFYFTKKGDSIPEMNGHFLVSYFDFSDIYGQGYPDSIYNGLLENIGTNDSMIVPIKNTQKTRKLLELLKDENKTTSSFRSIINNDNIYKIVGIVSEFYKVEYVGYFDKGNTFHGRLSVMDTTGTWGSEDYIVVLNPVSVD